MDLLMWVCAFLIVFICIKGIIHLFAKSVVWMVKPIFPLFAKQDEGMDFGLPNETVTKAQYELKTYLGGESNKVFTPKTFAEYIGQARAKSLLQKEIEQSRKRNKVLRHVLISGPAGRGKTTLVETVANEAKVKMVETITSEIKETEDLYKLIEEADGGIVFLDEIHALPREQAEKLYTMMERFTYHGKPIKPFTLIGATTELGELIQNRKPFYRRFKIRLELEEYSLTDLLKIAKQYNVKSYPSEILPDSTLLELVRNTRYSPAEVVRLTEAVVYFTGDLKSVLKNNGIISDGYTFQDVKVLKFLSKNEKGAGLQTLVSYLDTSAANYQYEIEPYLLRSGLLTKGPRGRKITEDGLKMLKKLEKS